MSFKDIKSQDSAVSFLKGVLANERIAHSYVFFGPKGVGKRKTAFIFAKALNCAAPKEERPCGQCVPCRKIENFNHPDIFWIEPEEDKESIGIENVRAIITDIGLKPYEGKKKVYIIDDAGEMKHEAQNALLKTLEEPPTDSVLILITEHIASLFPTIVSRSQAVRFYPLKISDVKDILIKEYKADEAKAHLLSHLAAGSIGGALNYYKDEGLFAKRDAIINSLLGDDFFGIDFEDVSKEELRLCLDIMLTLYRDMLVAKLGREKESEFFNIDKYEAIMEKAKAMAISGVEDMIRQVMLTCRYLDQNANSKLAMSVLGLRIMDR